MTANKSTPTTNQGVQTPENQATFGVATPSEAQAIRSTLCLDWLSFHVSEGLHNVFMDHLGGDWKHAVPRWGYRYAWEHISTGVIVLAYQPHTEAEPLVVMSGKVVDAMGERFNLKHSFELLKWCASYCNRATRIDLALDVHDGGSASCRVNASAGSSAIETKTQKIVTMQSNSNGLHYTTYFGARTSPRFLRVYTKDYEGEKTGTYTRVEQELKKSAADEAFELLAICAAGETGKVVAALLARIVTKWGIPAIDRFHEQAIELPIPKRPGPSMEKHEWLYRQVVPTLVEDRKRVGHSVSLLRWLWREVVTQSKR